MDFPFFKLVRNEGGTIEIANEFSEIVKVGDIILLNGQLGSGKTFFIKHLCKNFGIENVSSPSFAIVNEYCAAKKVFHFDFYRIKKETELYDIGFEDYLLDESAIKFIEWANLWPDILPSSNYQIEIGFVNEHKRNFSITKNEK